jgi:hypothetical protein
MKQFFTSVMLIIVALMVFGCGDSGNGNQVSLEEKIFNGYVKNDRVDKFYELQERYDNNRVILWINQANDAMWVTNFTLWAVFLILPDLPEVLATGGVLAVFYGVAWWLGVVLTGGGILAVLAFIGGILGVIPGIPPAVMGIVYLCVMFSVFLKLFSFF